MVTDNVAPVLTKTEFMVTDLDYNKVSQSSKILLTFSEEVKLTGDADDDVKVVVKGTVFNGTVAKGEKANEVIFTLDGKLNVSETTAVHLLAETAQVDQKSGILDINENKAAAATLNVSGKVIDKEQIAQDAIDKLAAKPVIDAITALQATITSVNEVQTNTDAQAALTAYNLLSASEKVFVTNKATLDKVNAAHVTYTEVLAAAAKQESTGVNADATQPFDGNNDLASYSLTHTVEVDVATKKATIKLAGTVTKAQLADVKHQDGNLTGKVAFALYIEDVTKLPADPGTTGTFDKIAKYFAEGNITSGYTLLPGNLGDNKFTETTTVNGAEIDLVIDYSGINISND